MRGKFGFLPLHYELDTVSGSDCRIEVVDALLESYAQAASIKYGEPEVLPMHAALSNGVCV